MSVGLIDTPNMEQYVQVPAQNRYKYDPDISLQGHQQIQWFNWAATDRLTQLIQ